MKLIIVLNESKPIPIDGFLHLLCDIKKALGFPKAFRIKNVKYYTDNFPSMPSSSGFPMTAPTAIFKSETTLPLLVSQ